MTDLLTQGCMCNYKVVKTFEAYMTNYYNAIICQTHVRRIFIRRQNKKGQWIYMLELLILKETDPSTYQGLCTGQRAVRECIYKLRDMSFNYLH
jgi:hypothetical protein